MNKRKGEEYQLIWKDQPDFVRMAAKLNALVIPFAAVGGALLAPLAVLKAMGLRRSLVAALSIACTLNISSSHQSVPTTFACLEHASLPASVLCPLNACMGHGMTATD